MITKDDETIVLLFGKYSGQTLKDVFAKDIKYLYWAVEKTDRLDFLPSYVKKAIQKAYDQEKKYLEDYSHIDMYYEIGWIN